MLKLIDWENSGHLFRFYFGKDKDYWGDDWDDSPYEHNAGLASDKYITGYVDVAFNFDDFYCLPEDDYHYYGNTPFSKENFKNEDVPFLILSHNKSHSYNILYSIELEEEENLKIFFNLKYEDFLNMIKEYSLFIGPFVFSEK